MFQLVLGRIAIITTKSGFVRYDAANYLKWYFWNCFSYRSSKICNCEQISNIISKQYTNVPLNQSIYISFYVTLDIQMFL